MESGADWYGLETSGARTISLYRQAVISYTGFTEAGSSGGDLGSAHEGEPMRHSKIRGLTLVELVVVVAAVGLVASVVIPSLGYARDAARTVVCEDNLLMFGAGMLVYANENAGFVPGTNTSGVALRAVEGLNDPMHVSSMPVQSFDWMTPIMPDQGLPDNRAARFHDLYTRFACPQRSPQRALLYPNGLSACPDKTDFLAYEWPGSSYLMPAAFQFWGADHQGEVLAMHAVVPGRQVRAQVTPTSWEVEAPGGFHSELAEIGTPARKIFVADGTRYLDATGSVVIDVDPVPELFGGFASMGGWWSGSTAYGVRPGTRNWDGTRVSVGSVSNGMNLRLSYRHGLSGTSTPLGGDFQAVERAGGGPESRVLPGVPGSGACQDNPGMINVVCFDGHVERLNDRASRDIDRWYPSGSVVGVSEGMTDLAPGYVVP